MRDVFSGSNAVADVVAEKRIHGLQFFMSIINVILYNRYKRILTGCKNTEI